MSANFAQLQRDALFKLLSEPLLADLNIKSLRDLQSMQRGEDEDISALQEAYLVWTTPRAGGTKFGAGAIVNMPEKEYLVPNVPGPERRCLLTITTLEDPVLNLAALSTSTGKTAEEWSDLIEAILHQWSIGALGSLYVQRSEPNRDIQGVVGYDSKFFITVPRDDVDQVAVVTMVQNGGSLELSCATSGAAIYYTKNASALTSFPGSGNPDAVLYSAPFAVSVGDVIRAAAYKVAMRGSDVEQATIT
jgi:hypothetical protein